MEDEDVSGSEEAVRVFVRIRPLNKRELAEKQVIGWNFNETAMLEDTPNGQRVYAYDHCFGPDSTNQETYDIVGKPVVLKAMEGYNGTVFTYGQTGSGKTWTMRGCETDPGMMILCVRDILDWVKTHPNVTYSIKISYLEVYNEEINDLLGEQGPSSKNLKIISEDAARGAVIGGLVEESATTAEDFMAILQRGEASRSYASTNMNSESSRSHTIYRVTIEAREKIGDEEGDAGGGSTESTPNRVSYLNLVDLAGSERQKSTKAEGKVLKEGANINKSLLALGAVINKLGEACKVKKGAKPAFIPYRDSKLTRILKQSLGGNTLTSILCAVTPAPMHREETVSTLKFGQTCKSIKNNVKSNDGLMDDKTLIRTLRATVAELRQQLEDGGGGDKKGDAATSEMMSRQKAEYDAKMSTLEKMLLSKGVPQSEITVALQASTPTALTSASSDNLGGASAAELNRLNEKLSEQQKHVAKLQRMLDEYGDLDELKAQFEEYEHNVRQELDEGRQVIEDEKSQLTHERMKLLKDRSNIDEKESRIGILITNLDEKESKLRQLMATMREQQEQWNRSVNDLQRREDLVDDWQRNHKQREKKLLEIEQIQEKKFAELNKREAVVLEEENRVKQVSKELSEREQRLQIGLSRIANAEVQNNQKEEQLQQFENTLKKRAFDCDVRERELLSRRKEMESWDALLREKDRKVTAEQKSLDDREANIRTSEEKLKKQEIACDHKAEELKVSEQKVQEMLEKYEKLLLELDEKDKDLKERDRELQTIRKELTGVEEDQKRKERHLQKLAEQMRGIEHREKHLRAAEEAFKAKEDEFYNVKVAQITARHNQELCRFEDIIQRQLKVSADFQRELEGARGELASKVREAGELQELCDQRALLIDQLKEQLERLEAGGGYIQHGESAEAARLFPSSPSPHTLPDYAAPSPLTTVALDAEEAKGAAHVGVSGGGRTAGHGGGHSGVVGMASPQVNPYAPDFFSQLALTKNMLHQVLEKYDALPDSKSSPLMRRAASAKWKSPPPPQQSQPQPTAQPQQEEEVKKEEIDKNALGNVDNRAAQRRGSNLVRGMEDAGGLKKVPATMESKSTKEATSLPPPPPPASEPAPTRSSQRREGYMHEAPHPPQIVTSPPVSATFQVPTASQLLAGVAKPTTFTSPPSPRYQQQISPEEKAMSPQIPNTYSSYHSKVLSPQQHASSPSTGQPQVVQVHLSRRAPTSQSHPQLSNPAHASQSPYAYNAHTHQTNSPVPKHSSPVANPYSATSKPHQKSPTPQISSSLKRVFGREAEAGVVAGDYEEGGVPVTVVNLNKRAGIKKLVQNTR